MLPESPEGLVDMVFGGGIHIVGVIVGNRIESIRSIISAACE